jgi:hypothetical protein
VITRSDAGPIIVPMLGAQLTLEFIEVSGATATNFDGYGIQCDTNSNLSSVVLREVLIRQNVTGGFFGRACGLVAEQSTFRQNGRPIECIDSTVAIDRCEIVENGNGIGLDSGTVTVTNNVIARNYHPTEIVYGITFYTSTPGSLIEFNTIADNTDSASTTTLGAGISCQVQNIGTVSLANNIIVRNKHATQGSNCTYPGSIIRDSDLAGLNFKSPDAAPYDYHLQAGSIAIDMATISTLDHDFDGDARPQGMQRDVGADEFVP